MQIFVPFREPFKVAECLDSEMLERQLNDAKIALDTINKSINIGNGFLTNSVVSQYDSHRSYLFNYAMCLSYYRNGSREKAKRFSDLAMLDCPDFLTEEYCNQHKRMLFASNNEKYRQFAGLYKENQLVG